MEVFKNSKITPYITLIVAAYNEERVINEKIKNTMEIDYPKDKLEIIVASDASTDKTNEIVESFKLKVESEVNKNEKWKLENGGTYPKILLNAQAERKGKSAALNDTVLRIAKGDIVIFTDATTFLEKDAVKKLVRNFSDKRVGAVCGKVFYTNPDDSSISRSEGIYWKYDEFLKKKEGKIGVLPFVSGPFYGLRKDLYTPVQPHLPDDSVSPLGVYKKGYQVVFEEEAVAYERMASTAEGEFRIKSRGVVRELGAIISFKELLNPFKHPLLSWVLFSHRLLRWSVGFFLVLIFALNVFLLDKPFYLAFFLIQVIFYLFALVGFLLERYQLPITNNHLLQANRILSLPFYFSLVNIAALWGIIKFLSGKKQSTWKPVR